jgi:hypothetical protein
LNEFDAGCFVVRPSAADKGLLWATIEIDPTSDFARELTPYSKAVGRGKTWDGALPSVPESDLQELVGRLAQRSFTHLVVRPLGRVSEPLFIANLIRFASESSNNLRVTLLEKNSEIVAVTNSPEQTVGESVKLE